MNQLDTTVDQLWSGCMLSFITHAVCVSRFTEIEYEQGWDRETYCLTDSKGSHGCVDFDKGICVGVVFDSHSDRFTDGRVEPDTYVMGAPEWAMLMAPQLAPRLTWDHDGNDAEAYPAITCAFWATRVVCFHTTPWMTSSNGGHLLQNQMAPKADAIDALKEDYEMTDNEAILIEIIFERKCVQGLANVILSKTEVALLGRISAEGRKATRRCLAEIGVTWES